MKDYTEVIPVTFKISAAQKKKLDELAKELNRSRSELVREAIMALLGVYYATGDPDALVEIMDKGLAGGFD